MCHIISHNGLCFVIELSISKGFLPSCRFNGAHFFSKICQRRNSKERLFLLLYKKHQHLLNFTHSIFTGILSNDFIIACNDVQQTSTQNQLMIEKIMEKNNPRIKIINVEKKRYGNFTSIKIKPQSNCRHKDC